MTTVHAWQHVYANVEKERSPHNEAGFQTLFFTLPALTEAEVNEIEARLLYRRSVQERVKRICCVISTGKILVAQVVNLADPDSAQRLNRSLAHSLVFTPEEFVRIGANPFEVFRHFSFLTTVEEALEQGDFQTGDIPAVSLDVPITLTHGAELARAWPVEELKKLVLLALRADRLARDRSTVAFVGEPPQVENALETAFLAVPTPLRLRCSFDTYFYKCNPVATYYWAVGLLEPPNNPRFTVVDLRSRQIQGASRDQPETAYERWVMAMIDANNLDLIAQHTDHAFALCEWLESRAADVALVDATPSAVVTSVFDVNARQVRERLRLTLSEQLLSVLVNRIFERIYGRIASPDLFPQLRHGFKQPQFLETLAEAYKTLEWRTPEREEVQALGDFLRQADHSVLHLVHLCWTRQRTLLRQSLERLSNDEYREFVELALHRRIVDPVFLLVPGKGDVFLDLYCSTIMEQESDLVALVEALLEIGEPDCISRLTPFVSNQPDKQIRALQKVINNRPDIPEPFHHAVSEAVSVLSRTGGVKNFLRTLFNFPARKNSTTNKDDEARSPRTHKLTG